MAKNQGRSIRDLNPRLRDAVTIQVHPNGTHGSVIWFGPVLEVGDVDIPVAVFLVDEPNG